MKELFILNPKQQQAFIELRKVFEKCKKLNMYFYNNYGILGVTDKDIVDRYDDDKEKGVPDGSLNGRNSYEFRLPMNEWADDPHYFHLK